MAEATQTNPKELPASARKNARKKLRPTYSCLNCHKRKVKCDRVKPCGACCLRGTPSECEYGGSKQDHHYIEQSAVIENLSQVCNSLKRELEETRRQANLPVIKQEGEHAWSPSSSESGRSEEKEDRLASPNGEEQKSKEAVGSSSQSPEAKKSGIVLQKTGMRSMALANHIPVTLTVQGISPLAFQKEASNLSNPSMARALVELFTERMIEQFSPAGAAQFGGTMKLRQAAELRVFSPILCNAFEAASLTFAGAREQIKQLQIAGHARYVRVLRQLQSAIYHPEKSQSTDTLVVVLLSTIIEAHKNNSADSLLKHQLGGLQLLRARTPYRHRYGLERSLFVDLRLYWVTAALAQRKPTFLANKEWVTVPWMNEDSPKDIMHRVLDIAVDIPGYLFLVDSLSAMLKTDTANPHELIALQNNVWETATELDTRLRLWESVCYRTYPGGGPRDATEVIPGSEEFPVFTCRDPNTLETLNPPDLVFPDVFLATSMCFCWAMRLTIAPKDDGLPGVISLQDRYESACNICRSMRYYVHNIPGSLVSRMLFVLRTANDSFSPGTVEKQFIMDLYAYIGKKFNFPVFSSQSKPAQTESDNSDD